MADWTETYRPDTLQAIRGNDKACKQFSEWASAWPNNGKAVILHGSPGVGKTSSAHALARERGWEPIELNASDQRTAAVVERIAGAASQSASLTGQADRRKLIILDEADNLHGNIDRGGTAAITRLVKDARQPVVLIANEFYDMSNGLRNACTEIEFRDISARSIVPVLRDICRKESIEFEESALELIAEVTAGDLRSAINDLQAIAEQTGTLTTEDVVTGERNRSKGIFPFLDEVFKEASAQEALQSAYAVDETPDSLLAWVEDNMPKDYAGDELARGYRYLASADRWLGRVRASQTYRYWRYATDNIAAGVAAARSGTKGGWTRYGPPSYWSKLGRSRSKRDRRDHVARGIAEGAAMSMSTARREVLPYLSAMTHHCTNRELTVAMAARYDLDASHISFVTGSGENTNKVEGIVAEANERREPELPEASADGLSADFDPRPGVTEDDADADEEEGSSGDDQSGLEDFF